MTVRELRLHHVPGIDLVPSKSSAHRRFYTVSVRAGNLLLLARSAIAVPYDIVSDHDVMTTDGKLLAARAIVWAMLPRIGPPAQGARVALACASHLKHVR